MTTPQVRLKKPFLVLLFGLSLSGINAAGEAKSATPKPAAKKINSHLYEADDQGSISGKVKVLREIQEETEVFLDASKGSAGPYVLPQGLKNRAAALKSLRKSERPGGPTVTITVDEQQRITSVQENESSTTAPGGKPGEKWEL
jgi:hypothetical protein